MFEGGLLQYKVKRYPSNWESGDHPGRPAVVVNTHHHIDHEKRRNLVDMKYHRIMYLWWFKCKTRGISGSGKDRFKEALTCNTMHKNWKTWKVMYSVVMRAPFIELTQGWLCLAILDHVINKNGSRLENFVSRTWKSILQ